jgi:hypothetical protein
MKLIFAEEDDDSDTTEAEEIDYPEEEGGGEDDGSSSSTTSIYSPSTSSYEVYTPDSSSDSQRIRIYDWGPRVTRITDEMKDTRCSICLEPLVSGDDSEIVSCFDGCRKFFHYHCVCEQRRCPLCRRSRVRI